jgi:hypothetical protein
MDFTYAEVGTEVILGKGYGWVPSMEKFTGKKAIITEVYDKNYCTVDIDNGDYVWSIRAMILASDEPLLRPGSVGYDDRASRSNSY